MGAWCLGPTLVGHVTPLCLSGLSVQTLQAAVKMSSITLLESVGALGVPRVLRADVQLQQEGLQLGAILP